VQPSWDWCLACGYDPEGLRPAGWHPEPASLGARIPGPASSSTATLEAPATAASPVATTIADVRPQQISDPDWVQPPPRRRLSLLATAGVLAAIVVAVAGLVFVILMVLHQPVGTTRADTQAVVGLSAPAVASAR
jgi:hypothetical protein